MIIWGSKSAQLAKRELSSITNLNVIVAKRNTNCIKETMSQLMKKWMMNHKITKKLRSATEE